MSWFGYNDGDDSGPVPAGGYGFGPEPEYEARHTGTDRGAHHRVQEDGSRCLRCFELLDEQGRCWRHDEGGLGHWDPGPITHARNGQEALLAVQYVEFRALWEPDS